MSLSRIKNEIKKIKSQKLEVINSLIELNQNEIELLNIFIMCSGTKEKIEALLNRNSQLEEEKKGL